MIIIIIKLRLNLNKLNVTFVSLPVPVTGTLKLYYVTSHWQNKGRALPARPLPVPHATVCPALAA